MLTRTKKESLVQDLKKNFDSAKAVFLTNLVGVPSNDANAIRKGVREANGNVVITRNTLMKRAAEGSQWTELVADLKGNNALAFAFEDAPGVAKVLDEAAKEFDVIELKGGYLGDKALSADEVKALASLPSKPEMLAGLLNTFKSPLMAFANCLDGLAKMKEENGDQPVLPAEKKEEAEA